MVPERIIQTPVLRVFMLAIGVEGVEVDADSNTRNTGIHDKQDV